MFEGQAEARAREVRTDGAIFRNRGAIEQHVLDPHMIVEPFEMAKTRCGAGRMEMESGGAMPGEIDVVRLALCCDGEEARYPSTTRGIRLLHINRPAA